MKITINAVLKTRKMSWLIWQKETNYKKLNYKNS